MHHYSTGPRLPSSGSSPAPNLPGIKATCCLVSYSKFLRALDKMPTFRLHSAGWWSRSERHKQVHAEENALFHTTAVGDGFSDRFRNTVLVPPVVSSVGGQGLTAPRIALDWRKLFSPRWHFCLSAAHIQWLVNGKDTMTSSLALRWQKIWKGHPTVPLCWGHHCTCPVIPFFPLCKPGDLSPCQVLFPLLLPRNLLYANLSLFLGNLT